MDKNEKNEELLHDISFFLESAGCDAASASGTDAEGLPFESIDDFELDPISFEDQQAVLMERAEDLFVLCQRYGRHSKKYLEACTYLDQSIRSLGSGCITRIAIIKNGRELPKLHNLSTTKLFQMASFNYRKINAALGEDMRDKREFTMPLMGMLLRTYQTLERLRSTELRINRINIGDVPTTNEWKRSRTFVENGINRLYDTSQNEAPAFRQAISYPIDHDQLDKDTGFRMQDSDQCGMRNSELDKLKIENGDQLSAGSSQQAEECGNQDLGCRMQDADQCGIRNAEFGIGQIENEKCKMDQESGCRMQDSDQCGIRNSEENASSAIVPVGVSDAVREAGTNSECGIRNSELDKLKIENEKCKIVESAALTSEKKEEAGTGELDSGEDIPEAGTVEMIGEWTGEPSMIIDFGVEQPMLVSLSLAKHLLQDPELFAGCPDLKEELRKFVEHHNSS